MKIDANISWTQVRKHQTSIAIIAATVAVLCAVHFLWLGPTSLQNGTLIAQVKQQKHLIEKYQSKLEQAHGLKSSLEKQEQELRQMRAGLFQGNDPYQLAASLEQLFSSKDAQDLSVKSYQVLDTKDYGPYLEVRLKFYFMSSIQGLHRFLQSLEEANMVVAVDQIDIRKGSTKGGADLVVNVVLAALMEKGERPEKGKT